MELHLAIKNILKYQGEDFLLDPKMINALIDFQAYEQHPALKNIFRTLHQDGYIEKVKNTGEWDALCDQMVYEIERDYALPRDLVEYTLKSVGIGLGYNCKLPSSSTRSQNQQQPKPQPPTPSGKSWSKMTEIEKSDFLEEKLEVMNSTFSNLGIKLMSLSFSDFEKSDGQYYFHINFEIERTNTHIELFNEMSVALYDSRGKLRESTGTYLEGPVVKKYYTDNLIVGSAVQFTDIGRLVIYMK